MDQLVAAMSNGQRWRADWNKNWLGTSAQTAGLWYDLYQGGGNPAAGSLNPGGPALAFQPMWDTQPTNASGILHGGNVGLGYSGYTKSILNASVFSAAATTAPTVLMLVDIQGLFTLGGTTTGAQTVVTSATVTATNSTNLLLTYSSTFDPYTSIFCFSISNSGGSLPGNLNASQVYYGVRQSSTTCWVSTSYYNALNAVYVAYSSAGSGTNTIVQQMPRYSQNWSTATTSTIGLSSTAGAGVQCFAVAAGGAMGTTTGTLTLTYTNSAGTASRATPSSPALPTCTATAIQGNVVYSGTASGKYGPFMPLQAGDAGIRVPTAINLSSTYTSGTLAFVLARPLLTVPVTTVGVAGERDLVNQLPSMPVVQDGACLAWIQYAGSATPTNSSYFGNLDFVWG